MCYHKYSIFFACPKNRELIFIKYSEMFDEMNFFSSDRYTKPGKGVDKNEPKKPAFIRFFITLWNKKYSLLGLNLLYVLFNLLTVAFIALLFSGCISLYGMVHPSSKLLEILYTQDGPRDLYFKFMMFFIILFTSVPVFTSGPIQAGFTFILKSYVKEEPCFLWHDFITKARSNFGIALKTSVINGIAATLISFNATAYMVIADPKNTAFNNTPFFMLFMMAAVIIFFAFLLTMISMYQYHMIVTFNITLKQLYRNAFVLVMVKWLPTLLIFLLECLLVGLPVFLLPTYRFSSLALILILYLLLYPAVIGLINSFFIYPIIKKYMIDNPNADKSADEAEVSEAEAAVAAQVNAPKGRFENGRWINDDEV